MICRGLSDSGMRTHLDPCGLIWPGGRTLAGSRSHLRRLSHHASRLPCLLPPWLQDLTLKVLQEGSARTSSDHLTSQATVQELLRTVAQLKAAEVGAWVRKRELARMMHQHVDRRNSFVPSIPHSHALVTPPPSLTPMPSQPSLHSSLLRPCNPPPTHSHPPTYTHTHMHMRAGECGRRGGGGRAV